MFFILTIFTNLNNFNNFNNFFNNLKGVFFMSATSFFHGVTVSLVDVGARTISTPSSSIIGVVDTFAPDTFELSPLTSGDYSLGINAVAGTKSEQIFNFDGKTLASTKKITIDSVDITNNDGESINAEKIAEKVLAATFANYDVVAVDNESKKVKFTAKAVGVKTLLSATSNDTNFTTLNATATTLGTNAVQGVASEQVFDLTNISVKKDCKLVIGEKSFTATANANGATLAAAFVASGNSTANWTLSVVDTSKVKFTAKNAGLQEQLSGYTTGELARANQAMLVNSKAQAVKYFGENSNLTKDLIAIFEQSKAVVVAVGVVAGNSLNQTISNIIGTTKADGTRTGLQALLDGKSLYNTQPRLLTAPGWSGNLAVATAMNSLAEKLRAIAIVDCADGDYSNAINYAENFGSKRIYMVYPGVKYFDTALGDYTTAPASPYVAGLFAKTDEAYGFWASPSNKEINGITGTTKQIEFLDGDETCRANLLNNANITTIIRDDGFRLWGNRTLSADQKWSFVTRVRTLDIVMDAILYGHKWAVDRSITKTYVKDVTEGLNNFMRDLKNQGAIVNFEVYADPELNTSSQLEQGKVYWNIRFTDVPPAENPIFRVEITNEWLTEVLQSE